MEHPRSHLVLTDGDFGRAYLADGWATRFLMEMFREYSVLFIGYSHQDPVMRLLALRTTTPDSLRRLLKKCADVGVLDAAALLFRVLLRPQLKFERPWPRPDFGGPLTASVEITIGVEEYDLRRL